MSAVDRILDANLNRAREALRVLEDFRRFVGDDAPGAAALKSLRHELGELCRRDGLGA
ncbi:MAG: thiamine phosphate synthase, partial [Planctomycetes bacterium]|nr:thiamine phosphate synthase [Planctomycetota bacterium]